MAKIAAGSAASAPGRVIITTLSGIAAAIASGLARIAGHSPWSGLSTRETGPISQASAIQRAGRAGRTQKGRCLRLYTRADFERRREHDVPEIQRIDLAETVLSLRACGVRDLVSFDWLDAPPPEALAFADSLLRKLSATDEKGELTKLGRRMLSFPLHPRLSRIVVEAERRGAGESGARIAALLAERDIRARAGSETSFRGSDEATGPSDVLHLLERFEEAESARFQPDAIARMGLDVGATLAVNRARKQLERMVKREAELPSTNEEEALLLAILTGFPDRLARRRKLAAHLERSSGGNLILQGGKTAKLSEASVVRDAPLLVAVDAEERPRQGVVVRLASAIEPEWLLDLYPDAVRDVTEVVWNAKTERVEGMGRLVYDGLVLDEAPAALGSEQASKLLGEAALAKGPHAFVDADALDRFLARTEILAASLPGFSALTIEDAKAALEAACEGRTSFEELRDGSVMAALEARLSPKERAQLAELAPERVRLRSGREAKVQYEPGKAPFLASRIQDFFGMNETPSIAGGRVPLVLHLLAPNQRAVQVTTDLRGFWERHYPSIRKELMRRYPKHAWPEKPI